MVSDFHVPLYLATVLANGPQHFSCSLHLLWHSQLYAVGL